MRKINSYLIFFLLLASVFAGVPFSFFGNNIAIAPANSTNTLGYELLDSNQVLKIWNHYDSYYFNVSNGIQFTNHYQEYWDKNVMMLGYYAGSTWNLLYRTDELSGFEKTIDLTETYCNATLWKDLTYAGYSFRLAIRYCLGVNDINLTVIPYIKNLGIDIPFQIAFGWEMKDIQVDGDIYNDYIKIDGTQYFLNQPLDNTYAALADSKFYLVDDTNSSMGGKVLYLDWDSSLDYLVQVKSRSGQYNAPVTLFIKIGTLASGQEKYTKIYWLDTNEDLTTFTEVDAGNYFSETATTCTFTKIPQSAVNEYVYKDYGIGYFTGTYNFSFELRVTDVGGSASCNAGIWVISNSLGSVRELNEPYYAISARRSSGAGSATTLQIKGSGTDFVLPSFMVTDTSYYLVVNLNTTGAFCDVYSNPTHTTRIYHTDMGAYPYSTSFRYLFCGAGFGYISGNYISGYVKYLNITYLSPPKISQNATTLPATNIKATSSTLNGAVFKTTTAWFQYGLTTIYGTNTTHQSIANGSFIQDVIGLTPGKLYHYRAVANNGTSTVHGNDSMFLTKPEALTSVTYTTVSPGITNISWTKGTGSNRTVIVEKTGSVPTSYSDGTEIYNDTGTYYLYTTSSNKFIQMWGFTKWINGSVTFYQYSDNSSFSIYAVFVNCYDENTRLPIPNFSVFFTNPSGTGTYAHDSCNNPHAISVSNVPQEDDISLTVNATGYYVRTYIMDIVITSSYYINTYLPPETAPGNGTINCELRPYIDSTTITNYIVDAVITFTHPLESMISVELYNDSLYGTYGGWIFITSDNYTYTSLQLTIEHEIMDVNTTMVRVNYYYNFCTGGVASALYNLHVVETITMEYTSYDKGVEGASVIIKRYMNATMGYQIISSLISDANGYVNLYLVPNANYKVFISKTEYNSTISDYIPALPNVYGQTVEKVFRIVLTESIPVMPYIEMLFTNITYSFFPTTTRHPTNYTFWYNISSSDGKLQWYRMRVLYYNNTLDVWILLSSQNKTGAYGGSINYTLPNVSGKYTFQCFFKKTGYAEYEFGETGSLIQFIIFIRQALKSVPDYAWFIITIILMIVGMGYFMRYFASGIATGYIGLGIFAMMLMLKDFSVPLGGADPITGAVTMISGWLIWGITFLIYTMGVFLYSRI